MVISTSGQAQKNKLTFLWPTTALVVDVFNREEGRPQLDEHSISV